MTMFNYTNEQKEKKTRRVDYLNEFTFFVIQLKKNGFSDLME